MDINYLFQFVVCLPNTLKGFNVYKKDRFLSLFLEGKEKLNNLQIYKHTSYKAEHLEPSLLQDQGTQKSRDPQRTHSGE